MRRDPLVFSILARDAVAHLRNERAATPREVVFREDGGGRVCRSERLFGGGGPLEERTRTHACDVTEKKEQENLLQDRGRWHGEGFKSPTALLPVHCWHCHCSWCQQLQLQLGNS